MVEATGNITQAKAQQKAQEIREQRERQEAQAWATKISQATHLLKAKAAEDGRLYGSVTSKDISQALEEQKKIKVDKRKINLAEPIRYIGEIQVEIKILLGLLVTHVAAESRYEEDGSMRISWGGSQSIEAEQSVLGSMLIDREAIAAATEILRKEDFYREAHGEIFDAIVQIYNRSEPVDLITLPEQLKNTNTLEQVGGVVYISQLANIVPSSSNVRHYARIVEGKSLLRKLIKASSLILDKSYEAQEDVNELIELAEKRIFDISQGRSREGFTPIQEVLLEAFDSIEKRFQNKNALTGISTGFHDIDEKTSGLQKIRLYIGSGTDPPWEKPPLLNIARSMRQ